MTVVRLGVLLVGVWLSLASVQQVAAPLPPAAPDDPKPRPKPRPEPRPERPPVADPAITTQIDQERNVRAVELVTEVAGAAEDPSIRVSFSIPVGKAHGSYELPPRHERVALTGVAVASLTRWPSGADECHAGQVVVDGRTTAFANVGSKREIEAHRIMKERLELEIDPDTMASMAAGSAVSIRLCALSFSLPAEAHAHLRALAAAAGLM